MNVEFLKKQNLAVAKNKTFLSSRLLKIQQNERSSWSLCSVAARDPESGRAGIGPAEVSYEESSSGFHMQRSRLSLHHAENPRPFALKIYI